MKINEITKSSISISILLSSILILPAQTSAMNMMEGHVTGS